MRKGRRRGNGSKLEFFPIKTGLSRRQQAKRLKYRVDQRSSGIATFERSS
jgi:hypothetical protein